MQVSKRTASRFRALPQVTRRKPFKFSPKGRDTMNQEILLYTMTGFVIISAIALCIQAGLLFGMKKATKAIQEQATAIMPQAKSILSKAESTLDQSRKNVVELTERFVEIS